MWSIVPLPPNDVRVLIPRTCDCVNWHGKRDVCGCGYRKDLHLGRPSGLLVWVQCSPKGPQKSEQESGGSQLVKETCRHEPQRDWSGCWAHKWAVRWPLERTDPNPPEGTEPRWHLDVHTARSILDLFLPMRKRACALWYTSNKKLTSREMYLF